MAIGDVQRVNPQKFTLDGLNRFLVAHDPGEVTHAIVENEIVFRSRSHNPIHNTVD